MSSIKKVDILLRELCHLNGIKIPNEAAILMHGESSSVKSFKEKVIGAPQVPEKNEVAAHDDGDSSDESESDQDESIELDESLFDVFYCCLIF